MGFSIYPDTKMDEHRMVAILQRARPGAGAGQLGRRLGPQRPAQDPRTGEAMLAAGFTDDDVDRVLWRNPVEFYGQSGRARRSDLDVDGADASATFEGNSILRGARD